MRLRRPPRLGLLLALAVLLAATRCAPLPPLDPSAPGASVRGELERAHEMRGLFIATVHNLDWPPRQGMPREEAEAALVDLVKQAKGLGFNALFFQVRPESDALYASTLEPWSRFLTGAQGSAPGFDPLALLLAHAHAEGLEIHAWLNPYRGLARRDTPTAANHITRVHPQAAISYDGAVIMDPASPAVRGHVLAVVDDLLDRYDLDGVHFDDYFYPYPAASGEPFPDDRSYARYRDGGGALSKEAWRRENVNQLIREVMSLVQREHPAVRFGVSPFGIHRSGEPPGITGLSAVDVLGADAPRWMAEGWVDYLAPQLYWPVEPVAQSYRTLAEFWAGKAAGGRHVFPTHALHRVGPPPGWPVDELRAQVELTRSFASLGARGDLHFRARVLLDGAAALRTLFHAELHASPALVPPLPRPPPVPTPVPPLVTVNGHEATLQPDGPGVRFLVVYGPGRDGVLRPVRVLGARPQTVKLEAGPHAASSVARGGNESAAVRFEIQ